MLLPQELMELIRQGEGLHVEFKKSVKDVTKDVYDTVCSFSNRDGGHIFLGVSDDGTIIGVDKDRVERMKKDFVNTINNESKIYPPLYLTPEEYESEGATVIHVYVPSGRTVYRKAGRIFDRNNDSDIDITNNADMVFRLYARKQSTYFVNKVYPEIPISAVRHDLIERAKEMARAAGTEHPWVSMTDDEAVLRSCGLILEDPETNKEGITLAGILLFGTDSRIMSVLPQHKTDAIFRVVDVDRYDDREVVTTNLIESYDRLMEFGKKHLNDLFTLDGIQRVSSRDAILREIISNLLMHRDFSSGYTSKLVIERGRMTTENANLAHGHGVLNLKTFRPYAKNPPIAKVFREIGLAEELGSGMRNSYKYTKLYSGGVPVFTEGDVFTTEIPLSEAATITVGGVRQDEIPAGMPSPENSIMENPTQSAGENPTQSGSDNPTQSGSGNPSQTVSASHSQGVGNLTQTGVEDPTQTWSEKPTQSAGEDSTQTGAENPSQSSGDSTKTIEIPTQSSGNPTKGKGSVAKGSEDDPKKIRLSEKEQALIDVLLNHPDYTQAQIAENLGWNVNTVKYRMRRLIQNDVIEHKGARRHGVWKVMIKG